MKEKSRAVSAVLFFSFIFVFGLLTFVLPKKQFSAVENRSLENFPELSPASLKNRNFANGFEAYFSDHFTLRADWVALKTDAELLTGKTLVNNVYFAQGRLIQKLDNPDLALADKNAEAVNQFAEKYNLPVYMMIAPTAAGIYTDALPEYAPQYNQKAFIDYFYSKLSNSVTKLDIYSSLYSVRDEYIYYRNDHHWTAFGAYSAYSACAGRMGLTPAPYSSYDIEHASSDFYGTLYSKVLSKKYPADVIDIYRRSGGIGSLAVTAYDGISEKTYDSLYFREYLSEKDKYSVYLGQNMPLIKITTNSQNERKLLIIKDSYANCLIPFLAQHYREIAVVDMRKLDALSYALNNYVDFESYGQTLILYNADTLAEDADIKKITR